MKRINSESIQPVKFLTPAQLSARWICHEETVRRKIRENQIPAILLGRRRLIPLEAIERLEHDALA
jgi:excisionase family DNA binding protein